MWLINFLVKFPQYFVQVVDIPSAEVELQAIGVLIVAEYLDLDHNLLWLLFG